MTLFPDTDRKSKEFIIRRHFAILMGVGVIVFSPIASFSFLIGWDDQVYVLNRFTENGLNLKNIYVILTEFYHGQYSPLNQLFYSTLFYLFGYKPLYFHVACGIIHIANALLVYKLISRITPRLTPIENSGSQYNIAFMTAMLFLLAPINLEPVAWVAASKVLIYAVFYLGALLLYIKYIESEKPKYYYLMLFSFFLSFASKEQAMTFPMTMILIDFVFSRNMKKWVLWLEKIPPALLSALFLLAALQSQGREVFTLKVNYSFADRIVLFFYSISEYFTKTILPVNLSYVYPFPFLAENLRPLWLWAFPLIIILTIFCLRRFFLNKSVLFGILFFVLHIALVCNIISLSRHSVIADRYAYLASIGLLFLVSVTYTNFSLQAGQSLKKMMRYGLLFYLLYFIAYTSSHIWVWQNAITLKEKVRTVIKDRSDYEK